MRKFIYSFFAVLALSCIFVSCSDDDSDGPRVSQTPASDCVGTYTGTWSIDSTYAYQTSSRRNGKITITGDTLTGSAEIPGTATVSANGSSEYVAGIAFSCVNLLNCNTIVNIASTSGGYAFQNPQSDGASGLQTKIGGKSTTTPAFAGTISDNKLVTSFTLQANDTVGSRRASTIKAWTYTYTFNGTRN